MGRRDLPRAETAVTRVLIIDDEESARRSVARALRDEGWEVIEAADGPLGLEAAVKGGVTVVLLDLRLPGLAGEEVLRQLRQISRVPVIVISAKRAEDDRVGALDMGADDYLVKPFTLRELVARVRAVLRRVEGEPPATLSLGDVTVDLAARVASRAGSRVALTAQEFAVLECLARSRGRLVTRAMLETVLHPGEPPPADAVSNVIDVIVLRLRKKLGSGLITTRRGQGFIIDAG